jgi:hypothetical protein
MTDGCDSFIGEPAKWQITLHDGRMLTFCAHSYGHEDDYHVFSLFLDGAPPVELKILWVPSALVKTVYG